MAYVTVEHQLDVQVKCSACGNSLDIGDLDFSNGDVELTVSPCETCLAEATKESTDDHDDYDGLDGPVVIAEPEHV